MYDAEIKRIMELDPATARGRNKSAGREIDLRPEPYEIERAARERTDAYIAIARDLADVVRASRFGIADEELERIELVREELFSIAKDVLIGMVNKG